MSAHTINFEELLSKLREEFLAELPARLIKIEKALFTLNKQPEDTETFHALFREVHSIKGSGGTHGLPIISNICHQLESTISQAKYEQHFDSFFLSSSFALCALIKQVTEIFASNKHDINHIELQLDELKKEALKNKKSVLIIESSKVMARLYQQAIDQVTTHIDMMDDGLLALNRIMHEKFDLIILGGEIKSLNARALIAALRESMTINSKTEIILISSKKSDAFFPYAERLHHLRKDQQLAANLEAETQAILAIR
jgi:chemotaxis protein histidine kinase CheA